MRAQAQPALAAADAGPPPWPHEDRAQRAVVEDQRWHWLQWPAPRPAAPVVLLLHGTGASSHSWHRLAPMLAGGAEVVAPDLPGHGRSGAASGGGASLTGMAAALARWQARHAPAPDLIVGHSAGAALAVQWALDAQARGAVPPAVLSINGALLPPGGAAGRLFLPLARLLALNPLVPHVFAWRAADGRFVRRLLEDTGSRLNESDAALYRRLVASPAQAAGALAMMARWDLGAFAARLPALQAPLALLVGTGDRLVPPATAEAVQRRLVDAGRPPPALRRLQGLGHLAHEEAPSRVARAVRQLALGLGVGLGAPGSDAAG